jgi:hypothetical protein
MNFYNEVHILCLAHHVNVNLLLQNLPNKIEHVLTKMQTKNATSLSQSVKPKEVHESVCLTLCFGVYLVKDFAVFLTILWFISY